MKLATSTKTAVVIDVVKHGYFKVLGKGTLPNIPDSTIQHLYNNYIIINIEKFNCKTKFIAAYALLVLDGIESPSKTVYSF